MDKAETDFQKMLDRLAQRLELTPLARERLQDQRSLELGGLTLHVQDHGDPRFFKLYVPIGVPAPAYAPDVHRQMLERSLAQPAPFFLMPALAADTGQLVLTAAAPLAQDEAADAMLLDFIAGLLLEAQSLQSLLLQPH